MTDRLDDLLFSIGEEQNDRVDFDQMYADLLQKQKEEEKKRSIRRSRLVRYGAMAACGVALIGIGTAMLSGSREEAPQSVEAAPAEEALMEEAGTETPMMAAAQETEAPVATESAPKEEAADKGSKSKDTAAGGAGVEIGTCDDAWSRLKAAGIEAEPYDSEDAPEAGYALMTGEGEAIWNAGSGVYRVTLNGDIAEQLKELCE